MLVRLVNFLVSPVLWVVRIADGRSAMRALGQLDDRELADIGLTRQDLADMTALPLGADPTLALASRASERAALARQARRRPAAPPPPSRMAAE